MNLWAVAILAGGCSSIPAGPSIGTRCTQNPPSVCDDEAESGVRVYRIFLTWDGTTLSKTQRECRVEKGKKIKWVLLDPQPFVVVFQTPPTSDSALLRFPSEPKDGGDPDTDPDRQVAKLRLKNVSQCTPLDYNIEINGQLVDPSIIIDPQLR
jgi:hypothetical protein